ncbi:hypothetical protein HK096_004048 [Nowakowskiella sp. JEL0078]|nr:hypothetical protein HK096_004048 [Nowakowskiella sp. JEL0078]
MTILNSHMHSDYITSERPYFKETYSPKSKSTFTIPDEQSDIQWIPIWDNSEEFTRKSVLTRSSTNLNSDIFSSQIDAIRRLSRNFSSPNGVDCDRFDVIGLTGEVDETAEADIREFHNEILQPQHFWEFERNQMLDRTSLLRAKRKLEVVGGLSSASSEHSSLEKNLNVGWSAYSNVISDSEEQSTPNNLRFIPLDQQLALLMSETSLDSIQPTRRLEKRRSSSWKKENFFEKFGLSLRRNSTKSVSENTGQKKSSSSSTKIEKDLATCEDEVMETRRAKTVSRSQERRFVFDTEERILEKRFASPSNKSSNLNAYSPERSGTSRNSTEIHPSTSPTHIVDKVKFVSKIPLKSLVIHRQSITSVDSGITFLSSQQSTLSRSLSSRPQANRHLQNLNALDRLAPPLPVHITSDWGDLESQGSFRSHHSFSQSSGPPTPVFNSLQIRRSVDQLQWDHSPKTETSLRRSFSNPENESKLHYQAISRNKDQLNQSVDLRSVPKKVGNVVSYVKKWTSMGKLKQPKGSDDWGEEFSTSLGIDSLLRRKSNGDIVPWAR